MEQPSISPGLSDWKNRLESDSRNPVFLKNLQWDLPEGIILDPVYDAASLGPEHHYLREFHTYWRQTRPEEHRPVLKVSSMLAKGLTKAEVQQSETLGFSSWVGNTAPEGHSAPHEIPFINDPVSESLRMGKITESLEQLLKGEVPETIEINSTAFHNAGANAVQDIAYCLTLAAHYRELLGNSHFEAIAGKIVLHLSIGSFLFPEIARLRALRLLWMNFTSQSGMDKLPGIVQAESSLRDWSKTDPDGNLLRQTASAMAAIMGGADNILIHPHTLDPSLAAEAIRLSVNQSHLALEEAKLSSVFDPGSGSYLIEILTHKLAVKAWELFCEWQKTSLHEKLRTGFFVKMAEQEAKKIRSDFASGKRSMIGVNKHPSGLSRPCGAWPGENPSTTDFPFFTPVFLDA